MIIIDEYDRLFPNFASVPFVNTITIDEVESTSPDCKVRHAKFINVSGVTIPHDAVKTFRSLYDAAGAKNLLVKNCDGLFCNQDGDKLILNMCELKTTALKDAILDAKRQIISISTIMRYLLSHLQSYDGNIKVRGFIAARRPTLAQLANLKDPKEVTTREYLKLLNNNHSKMLKWKMEELWYPLRMVDVDLYFCEVDRRSDSCTIDYSRIV